MRAAFDLLGERGFEGLRTRDVAARVGVNIATLHYHFPAKEDLIKAVASYLVDLFASDQAPESADDYTTPAPLKLLRREFENCRYWRRNRPDLLTVAREFALRAIRDPELRQQMDRNNDHWRASIESFLTQGVQEGVFRADANTTACATLLMGFLWGAAPILDMDSATFDRACIEFETMLRR